MHILLIPSWYMTPSNPIRGNFFRNEGLALIKAGHQVGMLVPPSKQRTFHGLAEVRRYWQRAAADPIITDDAGLATYRIPWWGWQAALNRRARGELALRVYDRYCAEQGTPDIVHGQTALYGGYLAAYIGQHRDVPTVLTEYTSWLISGRLFPDQKPVVRYVVNNVDRRLVIAPSLQTALLSYAPEKEVEILGCVVDTDYFRPAAPPATAEPFTFVMIASLTWRKDHPLLLKAFSQSFRGENVRLRIAGTGYQSKKLDELRQLIDELGITEQVELLGLLSQDDLLALIQSGHVLVSSSKVETFGVTGIEALACGKPVVATRSGGPEFYVNADNGLLTDPGDVDGFAAALREIHDHYDRYDPAAIRAEVESRFSEAAIVQRLETTYHELLDQRAAQT